MRKSVITGLFVLASANLAMAQGNEPTSGTGVTTETTAKVEAVTDTPKKWSVTLLQETYIDAADLNRQNFTGEVAGDAFIGLGYALSDTQSVEIRQNWTMNQTDDTRNAEYEIYDTTLRYKDTAGFTVGNTNVVNEARFYIPVSEYSREVGKIEARYGLSFDQAISADWTATFANTVRGYYFYEQNDGQNSMRNYTSATATYKVLDGFDVYGELGYVARWYHTGSGLAFNADEFSDPEDNRDLPYWAVGTNFGVGPLAFTFYAEQDHNLRAKGNPFKFANEDEMFYSLVAVAAM